MAQLIVTATHDYRPDVLANIDEIIFSTTGAATATFGSNQFGGTGIANSVAITGDGFANTMRVVLSAAGTFSAAGWGFTTWDPAADSIVLDGTAGADTITGTSQADVINGGDDADTLDGGAGADRLNGGNGDDTFNEVDLPSGAVINGGDGFDALNLAAGNYNVIGIAFQDLERVNFLGNGTFSGSGLLFFRPTTSGNNLQQFAGVVGGTQALVVGETTVNLSNVTFLNWGGPNQTITINGFDGAGLGNSLTGSAFADTINAASSNFNSLVGGGGNDVLNGAASPAFGNTFSGGAGADALNGGSTSDTFGYANPSDLVAGETINGGGGTDTVSAGGPASGPVLAYDFSTFPLNSIERIALSGYVKATFSPAQLAAITEVDGDTDATFQHLAVTGTAIDLSAITFTDWGANPNATGSDPTLFNDLVEINGTAGADTLTGSSRDDTFAPGGGADTVNGGNGADVFKIAAQSDLVAGETLNGGAGTDDLWLLGGGSLDFSVVTLTDINRVWFRQGGSGTFTGTQIGIGAIDTVIGRPGADHLVVNGSAVNLSNLGFPTFADPGSGTVNSWEDGLDTITINGTAGADTLTGSARNDTFVGGAGADMLTGGAGDDRFVYAPGGGADTLIGFVAGAGTPDAIDASAFAGVDTLADVLALATQNGADTVINFGGGDMLTLQNVQKSSLNIDDFVGLDGVLKDFSGDGNADILWRHDNGTTNVFAMNGATVLSGANISQQVDNSWQIQEKADFNGDGHADILWRHQNGTSNIYLMNGATVLSGANITQQVDNAWTVRGAGDFNGDGNADILWRHQNGTSNIYLMDGQSVIGGSNISLQVDNAWTVQGVGDFNGDGNADILWRHANGTSNVFLMDGQTVIGGSNTSLQVDNNWTVQGVGDFNGDGNADILWRHANGTSNVFLMNGSTVIGGSNTTLQVDNAWSVADTGDYNGDGKTDILWRHQNGTTNVFLMDGATVIGGSNTSVQVDNGWHVV